MSDESDKFYDELHSTVIRWMSEGDKLTAYEVIGALEATKFDVMQSLENWNETKEEVWRGKNKSCSI